MSSSDSCHLFGARVRKQFDGKWYDGLVTEYDARTGYRVLYEDGDTEDLSLEQLRLVLTKGVGREAPASSGGSSTSPAPRASPGTDAGSATSSPLTARGAVGKAKEALAPSTNANYDAAAKWLDAALSSFDEGSSSLVLPDGSPNDELANRVHERVADWRIRLVPAKEVGAKCKRRCDEEEPPAKDILNQLRGAMRRLINQLRTDMGVHRVLPPEWGKDLGSRAADQRKVSDANRERELDSGHIFHDKRHLTPEKKQLGAMIGSALVGDERVDGVQGADVLACVEPGAAIGLAMGVGCRSRELTESWLQSMRHHEVPHCKSGLTFEYLSFDALKCKRNAKQHNQMMANVSPEHDGIGPLGISLLLRVQRFGPPPFEMSRTDASWKVLHTPGVSASAWNRRLKQVFELAGVHRASDDVLLNIGRHYGSRAANDEGMTGEGAAQRRNHSDGARDHYEAMRIGDLLCVANNDNANPYMPAHHDRKHHPLADAVLRLLFPALFQERDDLVVRVDQTTLLPASVRTKVRTDEHLNGRLSFVKALLFASRMALLDLVARPRHWERWRIDEKRTSAWRIPGNRVVEALFRGRTDVVSAMEELAQSVWEREEAEIAARKLDPAAAATSAIVDGMEALERRNEERHQTLYAEQFKWYEHARAKMEDRPCAASPLAPPRPPPPRVSSLLAEEPVRPPPGEPPAAGGKAHLKRKAEAQDDVTYFSSWKTLREALDYAKNELVPREKEHGGKWRRVGENMSRHRQWGKYKDLAAYVGLHATEHGVTVDEAVGALELRLQESASQNDFMKTLAKKTRDAGTSATAKATASERVLGL